MTLYPRGFAARRAAKGLPASRPAPGEVRATWARIVADLAGELGKYAGRDVRVADLFAEARRLGAATFPVEGASVTKMAEALLAALEAAGLAAAAGQPARVDLYLRAVRSVADTLDSLLHEERTRQAQQTWAGHGGEG